MVEAAGIEPASDRQNPLKSAHTLESILRARRAGGDDPDTCAHLIVQTAEALAHRFVLRGIHDLDRDAFVEQTTRLLAGYAGAEVTPRRRIRAPR
jgi:hypothetical protein